MAVNKDLVGCKFGKLVVLDDYLPNRAGTKWRCLCECGEYTYVVRSKLLNGNTKSCGCLSKKAQGLSNHKLYSVWANMKDRCNNENNHAYHNYGGKGIRVCDEWKKFLPFYNWAIHSKYEEGLTIERIDSDKDYCPSNCEWITLSQNTARANKDSHRRKVEYLYYGISPAGEKHIFSNANTFAKDHSLNANGLRRVARGERSKYKGWKFGYTNEKNI